MLRQLSIVAGAAALTACAGLTVNSSEQQPRGFDLTTAKETVLAGDNARRLEAYRAEWRYNRGDKNRPPRLCLAMSGGGMRSAAFNIGVLQGLHRAGVLDRVDVLSSVSGGGYALSWFYLQQAGSGANADELFDDNGRFQLYLANNSNLAYANPDIATRWPAYVWEATKWVPSVFANLFANGLFDWHANVNPLRRTYENGIERVFHLTPVSAHPEQDGFVNKAPFWSTSVVDPAKEITFPRLREFIAERGLPFFVINTTVAIDDNPEHYDSEFSKTIYEFTPLRHGSDAFTNSFTEFPFGVSRAVAISGAAKDSAITPGAKRELWDAMTNTDLGYSINNPDPAVSESTHTWNDLLPLPFYLAIPNYRDAAGTDIYLTDGGHSDNLATFSLVRRMCGEIIVVDAEHDPKFGFESLRRLKRHLLSEMGVEFELPEPFDPARPVRTGTIGRFPLQFSGAPRESRSIAVKYLKLSIDRNRLDQYGPAVREYYARHGEKGAKDDRFPQQSTGDINYNTGQFLAYRDLGADMVRIYLAPLMTEAGAAEAANARR